MEIKDRIKPAPDLRAALGAVLFCVMGILALRYGGSDAVARIFAIIFIGTGVAFGALGLSVYLDSRRGLNALRRSPVTSRATILDRQVELSRDRYWEREWHTYWVVVQFYAGEAQVTLRARVSKPFYDSLSPGATVAVRYAAADPRIALLEGEDAYDQARGFTEGAQAPVWAGRVQATSEPEAVPAGERTWPEWMLASTAGWAVGPVVRAAVGLPGGGGGTAGLVVAAGGGAARSRI
jgi:hypothetical protein